jgi:hypothetical protein
MGTSVEGWLRGVVADLDYWRLGSSIPAPPVASRRHGVRSHAVPVALVVAQLQVSVWR